MKKINPEFLYSLNKEDLGEILGQLIKYLKVEVYEDRQRYHNSDFYIRSLSKNEELKEES